MKALFIILTVLVIIASVLLTIVVLLQNSKGGGLASNFTTGNQTFGVRQTADLLEKITWGLVAFIFVVSVITTFVPNINKSGDITDQIETEAPAAIDFNGGDAQPADSLAE
ncbi:MAG: preprotein translocase subunit SecG [Candidatus Cryptobacteroides sp.]